MAITQLVISKADGTEVTVTPNLGDTLNFETTLRKNKHWGDLKQNALKMNPFRAWSAGRREGTITESWEEFQSTCLDVSTKEDDDADDDLDVDGLGLDTQTNQ